MKKELTYYRCWRSEHRPHPAGSAVPSVSAPSRAAQVARTGDPPDTRGDAPGVGREVRDEWRFASPSNARVVFDPRSCGQKQMVSMNGQQEQGLHLLGV